MAGSHLSVFLPQRTPNPSLHHNSLPHFDPCTYHGKASWRLREFFLRNAIPASSIGDVSAVLRRLQKPPIPSSFLFGRHWVALPIQSCWPSLPSRRVPPRKVDFPLPYQIPADVSYVFPHSVFLSLSS